MAQEPANQLYKLKLNSQLSTSSHKSIGTMAPLLSTGKAKHYFQHMATTKPYTSNGPIAIDQESKAWLPAHGNHDTIDGIHTETASNGPLVERSEYRRNRTKDYARKTKESSRHSNLHTAWMPMYFTQAQIGSQFLKNSRAAARVVNYATSTAHRRAITNAPS